MPALQMTPESAPVSFTVRKIGLEDLKDALTKGVEDSLAMPSFHIFLALLYPVALMWFTGYALALLFPLMAGFALVGPFVGIGLYEMSRCRELGLDTSWGHVFEVVRSRSISPILLLGLFLLAIFLSWIFAAISLYAALFGTAPPRSFAAFITLVFDTPQGWKLIGYGTAIGFVFAVGAFSISVISFPLLLDRDVGALVAVQTSVRAVLANPFAMAAWGLIVATLLVAGYLLAFVGLAVAVPVLAHASWHLYRRVVEPAATSGRPNSQNIACHCCAHYAGMRLRFRSFGHDKNSGSPPTGPESDEAFFRFFLAGGWCPRGRCLAMAAPPRVRGRSRRARGLGAFQVHSARPYISGNSIDSRRLCGTGLV
jgi:uncharacterized membrane protein